MATLAGQRPDRIPEAGIDYDVIDIFSGDSLSVSSDDLGLNEFDDLSLEDTSLDDFEGESSALDVEDILSELRQDIEEAVNFMEDTFYPEWEDAEEFYDGASDVPIEQGRSQVTKTVVRDAIRNAKPNAMRVFMQSGEIVEYEPAEQLNFYAAEIAAQQTVFVNELFWNSGGYNIIYNACQNSFLKKFDVAKAYYCKSVKVEYMTASGLAPDQLMTLQQVPEITIVDAEQDEAGDITVEVAIKKTSGEIKMDSVNLLHFFISEDATCAEDGRVIGERRDVTVSEALEMGLEYDDWRGLDCYDPEVNVGMGESSARRGYAIDNTGDLSTIDDSRHKFLLTEVYARFDLDGTGIAQLYRFWLGGTSYELLDYERVEENPYSISLCDPQPDAFAGRSLYDVLKDDQNTQTSLLRATCDNAHAANNHRLAYHETMVNGGDVNSKILGHPIRFRQPGMIQEIGISSTVGAMLPLLQYLDMDSQQKAGTTNAAMGLDPDALQSTDKEAVKNTIQLAQGQIELMVRNIAETGLAPLFNKLLRLSIRHNPRQQVIKVTGGKFVPVDQYMFTPDIPIKAKVGLGTADAQTKMMGLQQIAAKQEQIISQFGPVNPVCSINQLFNTITDMAALTGISSIGRYFNEVTEEGAMQIQQTMNQQAEASRQEKPSEGIIAAETIRAQARVQEQQLENEQARAESDRDTRLKMIEGMMKDDLERDKMAQQLAIEEAKITQSAVDTSYVAAQQNMERDHKMQQFLQQQAQRREEFMEQQRMQMMQAAQAAQQQGQQGQQAAQPPAQPPA